MEPLKWWQKAVFYQIYPRSFADGNGDGIGDLKGIIDHLDYLKDLGIDAIWLSPHFPSPQYDCGYDISNYLDVDPDYGTLDDFKRFLDGAHQRGIRVVLDLVLNHTSDQHPWFIESRSSRDNPKRDWFVWADPQPDGAPPNNWYSTFGGSAWEYDEKTRSYFYHFFFKEQPDLNWRNPEVKQAMFAAVRFWLDMGVDGFRLDAIGTIYEDPDLPNQQAGISQEELFRLNYSARTKADHQRNGELWEKMFCHQHDLPGVHDLMKELRALVDSYEDRVLIGETDDVCFYGTGDDELHLVFNFPLMHTKQLHPKWVLENQKKRLSCLPGCAWPSNTLGNHDSPRVYSRFGDGKHNDALARQNLVLLLALKGTPFLYNGEEIGMGDYPITNLDLIRDQLGLWYYRLAKEAGGLSEGKARKVAGERSRDKNRTPLQWKNAPNAGFSPAGVTTWLPVDPNYAQGVNVADQAKDENSLLCFYQKALQMRRQNPALTEGEYLPLKLVSKNVLMFIRSAAKQSCLVALNMRDSIEKVRLPDTIKQARVVFSTNPNVNGDQRVTLTEPLELAPFESIILEISS